MMTTGATLKKIVSFLSILRNRKQRQANLVIEKAMSETILQFIYWNFYNY